MSKTTILQAGLSANAFQRIKECFQYLDLLWMLSYRDIRVRYAQTFLGLSWAVINPVISVLLLHLVFNVVAKVDTQSVPPLVFTMAGICAWSYFARVVGDAGTSIIGAQSLVKKVYFPRLIIPFSKAMSALLDLGIVLFLLACMLIIYKIPLTWQALMIIPFILLTVLASVAFGVWISALTIRYRDFHHILPVVLRIGMFLSPIAYSASKVPENYKWVYNLNPLTGIIEGFRWAIFDTPFNLVSLWISMSIILITLIGGIWYFLRMEQYIADII
ncbi:MAG TPA: ABC transporter permease [Saprospiraceae bacterium]|nr:ABC transporter permease [Saprospiraceae bacterium]